MTALAYNKEDAAVASGVSRQTLDRAIKAGTLRAKRTSKNKDGAPTGRVLILAADLAAWLESLESA